MAHDLHGPRRAAIRWSLAGFGISLVVTLVIAMTVNRSPSEPKDAMFKRGQAAAPAVLLATIVSGAIGYLRAKKRQGGAP
jgi:hypothetical protein